jgi:hypothetical protein
MATEIVSCLLHRFSAHKTRLHEISMGSLAGETSTHDLRSLVDLCKNDASKFALFFLILSKDVHIIHFMRKYEPTNSMELRTIRETTNCVAT